MTDPPPLATTRTPVPADRDTIVEMVQATGLFAPGELEEVASTLDSFLGGQTSGDRWLVHGSDDLLTAVAYYAPERMAAGTWNLLMLAVHPGHQGHGQGSVLVRHVEGDLRESGARILLVETSGTAEFAGQRRFYGSLGYHEEARIREFYGPGDDKVVYWKPMDR